VPMSSERFKRTLGRMGGPSRFLLGSSNDGDVVVGA